MTVWKQGLIVALAAALAGFGYWYFGASDAPAPDGGPDSSAARQNGPARAMPVEAKPVTVGPVARRIEAVGSLRSDESVVIRPEIAGRIAQIRFAEGEAIERGAVLVILESSIQRAELAQAEAALALSQANYGRADELYRKRAGTKRALDEALARMRQDEARLQLARAVFSKTELRAPFSGVLGLRRVSVGGYVTPGQDIVNLENLNPIKLDFRVPEIFFSVVAPGQSVRVGVDAFPGRSFDGQVYAIDPQVDANGRALAARARIPNDDGSLRPGMFARIELVLERRAEAVLVPEEALVPRGDDQYVFRVVDGKAAFTRVVTGQRRAAMVEISEGLAAGDVVVTAGQMKIRDGMPVMNTLAQKPSAAPAAPDAAKPAAQPAG